MLNKFLMIGVFIISTSLFFKNIDSSESKFEKSKIKEFSGSILGFGCKNNHQAEEDPLEVQLISRIAKILQKEKNLQFGGLGGFGDKIESPYLGFRKCGIYDITDARKFIIFSAKTFLNEINKDEKIRPQLIKHPFPGKNIRVVISFYDKDFKKLPSSAIQEISLREGMIFYKVAQNQVCYDETYEDALKIMK